MEECLKKGLKPAEIAQAHEPCALRMVQHSLLSHAPLHIKPCFPRMDTGICCWLLVFQVVFVENPYFHSFNPEVIMHYK